jgi:hypothetical protein
MVIDTLTGLMEKQFIDKKKLLAKIIEVLHYDGKDLPPATRQDLGKIKERLTGSDFSDLLKRYAGMDLLEDKFDEEGRHINQTNTRLEALAQQIVEDNELIRPELGWLVTTEAQNGFVFGYELGKKDKGFALLPKLVDAQRNAGDKTSAFFLRVSAGHLQDEKERENTLTRSLKTNTSELVPELTRSGATIGQPQDLTG